MDNKTKFGGEKVMKKSAKKAVKKGPIKAAKKAIKKRPIKEAKKVPIFTKDFIAKVKAEYPKRISLHSSLDREETSVEWQLRQGAQFNMTAQEVIDCFRTLRLDKIYRIAKTSLRREALLAKYLRIRSSHQPVAIHHAKQPSKKVSR